MHNRFERIGTGGSASEVWAEICSDSRLERDRIHEKPGFTELMTGDFPPRDLIALAMDLYDKQFVPPAYVRLVDTAKGIWSNKRGPALCVKVAERTWSFTGRLPESLF